MVIALHLHAAAPSLICSLFTGRNIDSLHRSWKSNSVILCTQPTGCLKAVGDSYSCVVKLELLHSDCKNGVEWTRLTERGNSPIKSTFIFIVCFLPCCRRYGCMNRLCFTKVVCHLLFKNCVRVYHTLTFQKILLW